jgi:hypothetical protein
VGGVDLVLQVASLDVDHVVIVSLVLLGWGNGVLDLWGGLLPDDLGLWLADRDWLLDHLALGVLSVVCGLAGGGAHDWLVLEVLVLVGVGCVDLGWLRAESGVGRVRGPVGGWLGVVGDWLVFSSVLHFFFLLFFCLNF